MDNNYFFLPHHNICRQMALFLLRSCWECEPHRSSPPSTVQVPCLAPSWWTLVIYVWGVLCSFQTQACALSGGAQVGCLRCDNCDSSSWWKGRERPAPWQRSVAHNGYIYGSSPGFHLGHVQLVMFFVNQVVQCLPRQVLIAREGAPWSFQAQESGRGLPSWLCHLLSCDLG